MEQQQQKKRSARGCLWAVLIFQTASLVVSFLVIIGLLMFIGAIHVPEGRGELGADEYPDLTEVWSFGSGKSKAVLIPLKGMIFLEDNDGSFPFSSGGAGLALKAIRRATNDPKVRALILDVDSGGGGITASDILYKALLDFKAAQEGRKVVALFGDVAASGAYYVAMASDYIVAHPTTITGSIGVLIQSLNIKGLGEKIGVKNVVIKSGKNKDILNPFEDMTDEQKQMLQKMIDEMYERFVRLVAAGREMPDEAVREIADGQVFTASFALDHELIDEIGYMDSAMQKAAELIGEAEIRVYRYEEKFSLSAFLRSSEQMNPAAALLDRASHTRLLYLWQL